MDPAAVAEWIEGQLPLRLAGPPEIRGEAVLAAWPGRRPALLALLLDREPLGTCTVGLRAAVPPVLDVDVHAGTVRVDLPGSWHAWRAAVEVFSAWAAAWGAPRVEVDVASPEVGRVLADAGFVAGLGHRFVRHLAATPHAAGIDDPVALADAVTASSRRGAVATVRRRRFGRARGRDLDVRFDAAGATSGRAASGADRGATSGANGGAVRVELPEEGALLAEPLAAAVDELDRLRRRFPATRVDVLAFVDRRDLGTAGGSGVLGFVHGGLPRQVHLAAGYVLAEVAPSHGDRIATIRSVVAHEFWHVVERDLEVADYRAHVALRRELGAWFGLETFQQLYDAPRRGSTPAQQAAYARLGAEVGTYARTNPSEGLAMLFERWWCDPAPPPSAHAFGVLLERYLPTPPGESQPTS